MRWSFLPGLGLAMLLAFAVPVRADDVERGRVVAMGGAEAREAQACFRCHGLDGGGAAALSAPSLAGLSAYYLAKQMRDYDRGTRVDPQMTPIARALSAKAIRDVAAYYASMAPPDRPAGDAPAEVVALGRRIALEGVPGRELPPCAACHGPGGISRAPAIPTLAGQHADYLVSQLRQWRDGERNNDPLNGMRLFSTLLSDDEIAAVALWFSRLPPGGGE